MAGPSNRAALALVESWPRWPSPVAVITGPPGSGKTHLATIWAASASAAFLDAAAWSPTPEALPPGGALVVENVDPVDVPQRALFHLINSATETGGSLLVTARLPPSAWRIDLPDLRSRLRMATPAILDAPDDDLLRRVLVKLFSDRQIGVDKALVDYLLLRMERSLTAAAVLVADLDREALATSRPITRPFAAAVLARTGIAEGGESAFSVPQ